MKTYFLLLVIILFISGCSKNESISAVAIPENNIVIGNIDSLYSESLQEWRKIWIHVPASFNSSEASKYPVLYLLDGDAHFYSVAGLVRQKSSVNGNTDLPEMIIVGIPNTDRFRDLTPTQIENNSSSGGGEIFLDFLEKELIPYIDNTYPSVKHRTLIGHSLGGLTAINALIGRPQLFDNYLAIDPSLWWDDQNLMNKADSVLSHHNYEGKALYVAMAKSLLTDMTGMEISELEKDTSSTSIHTRSILQFVKSTEQIKNNQLRFDWKYYPAEDHGSIPLIAEYDGLHFLFFWYKLKGVEKYLNPQADTKAEDLVELIKSHYSILSQNFGYEILPPESLVNMMGQGFLSYGADEKALALFTLNVQNYPRSASAVSTLGDYYLSHADTSKAIENYTESLKISENREIQEKLNILK